MALSKCRTVLVVQHVSPSRRACQRSAGVLSQTPHSQRNNSCTHECSCIMTHRLLMKCTSTIVITRSIEFRYLCFSIVTTVNDIVIHAPVRYTTTTVSDIVIHVPVQYSSRYQVSRVSCTHEVSHISYTHEVSLDGRTNETTLCMNASTLTHSM